MDKGLTKDWEIDWLIGGGVLSEGVDRVVVESVYCRAK